MNKLAQEGQTALPELQRLELRTLSWFAEAVAKEQSARLIPGKQFSIDSDEQAFTAWTSASFQNVITIEWRNRSSPALDSFVLIDADLFDPGYRRAEQQPHALLARPHVQIGAHADAPPAPGADCVALAAVHHEGLEAVLKAEDHIGPIPISTAF